MSMESIALFYERLKEDKALQKGVKAIREQADFIAFAKGQDFDFTEEDMRAFAGEQAGNSVPLSDEELREAAGGTSKSHLTSDVYACARWAADPGLGAHLDGLCRTCAYWIHTNGTDGMCINWC